VARQIVELRADATTQERIDELAEKSTEGQLSPAEEAEYDDYVEAIDIIGILQAKARSALTDTACPDGRRSQQIDSATGGKSLRILPGPSGSTACGDISR
jgi:hypothetical protein